METEMLGLRFADGSVHYMDAVDAAAVLRRYVIPVPFVRSRRVFDMVAEYAAKHASHHGGGVAPADPDIAGWDRRFMERVRDTDTLHDLFLRGRS